MHLGAIVGAGLTKTACLEKTVRNFRKFCPLSSSLVGFGPTSEEVMLKKATDSEDMSKEKRPWWKSCLTFFQSRLVVF